MYAIEFQLTPEELGKLNGDLPAAAAELAQRVRGNQEQFGQRHLSDFSTRADVRQAGLRWRKQRRSEA